MATNPNHPGADTFEQVAKDILDMDTLEIRKSDSLDFYDLSVGCVREAFEAVWDAATTEANGGLPQANQ